ncbi:ABC transporter substrate-binding protein [Pseudothauera nasutitermitis]|uniref:ABC transporter substrate-binding protein n=1 Tax=Pseudothauera nasutitermitis TaxID=2565930 RepID=UPI001454BCAA|nr:ABC transporter substrate-binding protein [Pseudothauera nasutitermitis]
MDVRSLAAGVLLGVSLAGCAPPEPVRIGFIGGLSGRVSDLASEGKDGALLAVEQANAAGGVNGRPVELLVRDDAQDPEVARQVTGELIQAGVQIIVGPMTSAVAEAIIPLANQAGVVLVSPTVTSTRFSGQDDHFFRVVSTTREYASAAALFLRRTRGAERAALILDQDNAAYTEDWARQFIQAFEASGGESLPVERFSSAREVSLMPQVTRMLDAKPDLVVIVAGSVDAARLAQMVRRRAPLISLLIGDWAATERFVELGGLAVEGLYAPQYFSRDDVSPRYRAFRREYEERFGVAPGFASVAGYDAARVALDALALPGGTLRERLKAQRVFDGVQQRIEFDEYGDAARPVRLTVVRSRRFVPIDPEAGEGMR